MITVWVLRWLVRLPFSENRFSPMVLLRDLGWFASIGQWFGIAEGGREGALQMIQCGSSSTFISFNSPFSGLSKNTLTLPFFTRILLSKHNYDLGPHTFDIYRRSITY